MNCFAFSRPKIWKINGQVQSLVFALHVCLLGPPTLIFSWQCHSSSKLLHKQHFRAGFSFLLYFGLSPSLFLPLRLSASGQAPSSHDLSPFLTLSKPIGSGWHHCNTQMWQLGGGAGCCVQSPGNTANSGTSHYSPPSSVTFSYSSSITDPKLVTPL